MSKNISRKSSDLLPEYLRTEKNKKFLGSTLDQLISKPQITRLDGYVGSVLSRSHDPKKDVYLNTGTTPRDRYQLEPGMVVRNSDGQIDEVFTYDDLIDQVALHGGNTTNLDKLFRPEHYSFAPPISWDKLINFSEYYWLSNGPRVVTITGTPDIVASEYTVSDSAAGNSFVFSPDGLTPNPTITLYRGEEYTFTVASTTKFYIKTTATIGTGQQYTTGVTGNGTQTVKFVVPANAPPTLHYASDVSPYAQGFFAVKDKTDTTTINVESDIIGKRSYSAASGDITIDLINGLKIRFTDDIQPAAYRGKEFYVEGVGTAITLIDASTLQTPGTAISELIFAPFDGSNFDQFPFDSYKTIPIVPEYVTINRASSDNNPWSRYNRWFHSSVIELSYTANGDQPSFDSTTRAVRPIVEFHPNLQLYNFGSEFLSSVTVLDTATLDAFSVIDGFPVTFVDSNGLRKVNTSYTVDGVLLEDGHRVIFGADSDELIRGKIYDVSVLVNDGSTTGRISLVESPKQPTTGSSILVMHGSENGSSDWWFDGSAWNRSQARTARNQFPIFDIFMGDGTSYSTMPTTTFSGSRIFGYEIGTGVVDPVLGFPISYTTDVKTSGTYKFKNYFSTDSFFQTSDLGTETIIVDKLFFATNTKSGKTLTNIWDKAEEYQLPIIQITELAGSDTIPITAIVDPGTDIDLSVSVIIDGIKVSNFQLVRNGPLLAVQLPAVVTGTSVVRLRTTRPPTGAGYYETPLSLTNNPFNSKIETLTFSELSDHVSTMVERAPGFSGKFPGSSNIRHIPALSKYGTRLIANATPLSFSMHFMADIDHSAINAIRSAAIEYSNMKMAVLSAIGATAYSDNYASTIDEILSTLNQNKNELFPYSASDMVPYGSGAVVREYRVADNRNKFFAISAVFDATKPSRHAVLVYLNGIQLVSDKDYTFESASAYIKISAAIARDDVVTIREYADTGACYIAPTPTKMGLYPKFIPEIYYDPTYVGNPIRMIQCHDGSILRAYGDFRDRLILEFERRIYNNIKIAYTPSLVDYTTITPGAFRVNKFTQSDINAIIEDDFLRWANGMGVDFQENTTFDIDEPKTYNYHSGIDYSDGSNLNGNWRAIFRKYFDTDRPSTHPWEMLGFTVQPSWWEGMYGPAPYTSGNGILWNHIAAGYIAGGDRVGVDSRYARPGISQFIPVNEFGNVSDVRSWGAIAQNVSLMGVDEPWKFGDGGPVETAWRKSSFWPFAAQVALALCQPGRYFSLMANVAALTNNSVGQYVFDVDTNFISPSSLASTIENALVPVTGYAYYVIEHGKLRHTDYTRILTGELRHTEFNLLHKLGGFASKEKLGIVVDSISPTTVNPGVLLPAEDYTLHFNTSPVAKTVAASGVMVRKSGGTFVISGYDTRAPYFPIHAPIHQFNDVTVRAGGKSREFLNWKPNTFYQAGQVISYGGMFYNVLIGHSDQAFDVRKHSRLPELPRTGGAVAQRSQTFSPDVTYVDYGARFSSIQEVFDVLLGYGKWLATQGFIFDAHNSDIGRVLNWDFSATEFLYMTTQNWADGTLISLSPFAEEVSFQTSNYFAASTIDPLYEYSILRVDGTALSPTNISVERGEGSCTIKTVGTSDGIYFVRLNLVQKEHVLVLQNRGIFNDVIYDQLTGYKQARIKISGFKTSDWNGDYMSPGFVYDPATIQDWVAYTDYATGDVVKYAGNYYSANRRISGAATFDYAGWAFLRSKPSAQLLPNFDYKIEQFNDFYSLDIDNIDESQQKMAQHLIGYTPRVYLDNVFTSRAAQYKFYQGYIREKGTRNAIDRLSRASVNSAAGSLSFNEEWAFRVGSYGGYTTHHEIQFPLNSVDFVENPQIIQFTDSTNTDPRVVAVSSNMLDVRPENLDISKIFDAAGSVDDIVLPIAGYARADDVTATALNKDSLLNITNTPAIKVGDTFWVGFDDTDWGVYRYVNAAITVIGAVVTIPGAEMVLQTSGIHGLSVGTIISISRMVPDINGVYRVKATPSLDKITISTDAYAVDPVSVHGQLFFFKSARYGTIESFVATNDSGAMGVGELAWVDDVSGGWAVFEKTQSFGQVTNVVADNPLPFSDFGSAIVSSDAMIVVGSPTYYSTGTSVSHGRVCIFSNQEQPAQVSSISLNVYSDQYCSSASQTNFGAALATNSSGNLLAIGAPLAGDIREDPTGATRFARSTNSIVPSVERGLVKLVGIDPSYSPYRIVEYGVLVNPVPQAGAHFGQTVLLTPRATSNLLISAPGQNGNGGLVFAFNLSITNGVATIVASQTLTVQGLLQDSRFGAAMSSSADGSTVLVSAPGMQGGAVYVFTAAVGGYSLAQSIIVPQSFGLVSGFGVAAKISADGSVIAISAPNAVQGVGGTGKVVVYRKSNGVYTQAQIVNNPSVEPGLYFGSAIDVSIDTNVMVVSASGTNSYSGTQFDGNVTTYDSHSTYFGSSVANSGTAYGFQLIDNVYLYGQEYFTATVVPGSEYGTAVVMAADKIYIGAPGSDNIFAYPTTANQWAKRHTQDQLIDVSKISRVITVNKTDDSIVDYVDLFDPAKGRLPSLSAQELKYKTLYDPAVYSIGTSASVVDADTNWLDDHVGELWWDLSSVKYVWYEQGDATFRKNNWGSLFPGSSIDVYEWVRSDNLPSQWAAIADTNDGITQGISGQPKHADDTVISVAQTYDQVSGLFTNVYYFWVKNTVIVPANTKRRLSAFDVARLIEDPKSVGAKFISVIAKDTISCTNISSTLVSNNIGMNIVYDESSSPVNRHTEWALLGEESRSDQIPQSLERKLIDSLLGHDSVGNSVPDTFLPEKMRFGIGIRPRQSMFVNRREALRNIVEYANAQLLNHVIYGVEQNALLNQSDSIPDTFDGGFDISIADETGLSAIRLSGVIPAIMAINVDQDTGVLTPSSFTIVSSGAGYGTLMQTGSNEWIGPSITIPENPTAVIKTRVNSNGEVIAVEVVNPGEQGVMRQTAAVRPFTVLVESDTTAKNRWTQYIMDDGQWVKVQVQRYNTQSYWHFADWVSPSFNKLQALYTTVPGTYGLTSISPVAGQYVKVANAGDGRAVILRKTNNINGSFNVEYDLVYRERGTIQISDSIWDVINSNAGFDQGSPFDQTRYDQAPDKETENILLALRDNIFVGELKQLWHGAFFACVKYAMIEQRNIDWAFKTSFITAINAAGTLDQRPSYKLQNSQHFENYLNEIKPFKTQVRRFVTEYNNTEPGNVLTSDFDLPVAIDPATGITHVVTPGSSETAGAPYKSWFDNYLYGVDSIQVNYGGSGYTSVPAITIVPAPGDVITKPAKAEAFISAGSVYSVSVIEPGVGYTVTPTVIVGGGNGTDPARCYAILRNDTVRKVALGMRFDRTSRAPEMADHAVKDVFMTDGTVLKFNTAWAVDSTPNTVFVTVDGIGLLPDQYKIVNYTKKYTNPIQLDSAYTKTLSYVELNDGIVTQTTTPVNADTVFLSRAGGASIYLNTSTGIVAGQVVSIGETSIGLTTVSATSFSDPSALSITVTPPLTNDIPSGARLKFISTETATVVEIAYNKSVDVYNAIDRIENFYAPTIGMPGRDFDQLMSGFSFPGTTIKTLPLNVGTGTSQFGYSTNWDVLPYGTNFFDDTTLDRTLDTSIDGGAFTVSSSPIAGQEVIIDGSAFISADNSFAPEELLPGGMKESLAINVFTRVASGAGVIRNMVFENVIVGQPVSFNIGVVPVTRGAIIATYNNQILKEGVGFTLYTATNMISFSPVATQGVFGISVLGASGSKFIDSASATVSGVSASAVTSSAILSDIKSTYVTVNGTKISSTVSSSTYYVVEAAGTRNKRGSVKVKNLQSGTNTISAWFFGGNALDISEVSEQIVTVSSATSIVMSSPPRNKFAASSQMIVEMNGARLVPPSTTYKVYDGVSNSFAIDPSNSLGGFSFDYSTIDVYVNGSPARDMIDFVINGQYIDFDAGILAAGDEVAITVMRDCDYLVSENMLQITPRSGISAPSTVRIITFPNQDVAGIHTEVFDARVGGTYRLSHPVKDENYIWVSVAGKPLVNTRDFYLFGAGDVLVLDSSLTLLPTDQITVTSFSEQRADHTVGFRVFKDMVGRQHFKRIATSGSTTLAAPLSTTDASIVVVDGSALSAPIPSERIPGVVFINGERIEFMGIDGNTLTRLTRATLGTGARTVYPIGTTVVDSGMRQSIPVSETTFTKKLACTTATSYALDGLSFAGWDSADASGIPHNQIDVWYAGRLLQKPLVDGMTVYSHDFGRALDTGENLSDSVVQPGYTITGGNDGTTATITLAFAPVVGSTLLVIGQRGKIWYSPGVGVPANGASLLDTTTDQALFLRDQPAFLPDKYYYGQQ